MVKKKTTIDDLARMVKGGFDETGGRLSKLENRVYKIEGAVIATSDTLATMSKDIYEIKTHYV